MASDAAGSGCRPGPVVLDAAAIAAAVRRMATDLAALHRADVAAGATGRPLLVCVLKGSFVLTADLVRALAAEGVEVDVEFVRLRSYGAGSQSSGRVDLVDDVATSLDGRDVVVVEDVVDTGLTTAFLLDHLRRRAPRTLRLAALLDKPGRRRHPVTIDVRGAAIGDDFVVGYGLDLGERWRGLPDVRLVEPNG